jgi:hypothetical protein
VASSRCPLKLPRSRKPPKSRKSRTKYLKYPKCKKYRRSRPPPPPPSFVDNVETHPRRKVVTGCRPDARTESAPGECRHGVRTRRGYHPQARRVWRFGAGVGSVGVVVTFVYIIDIWRKTAPTRPIHTHMRSHAHSFSSSIKNIRHVPYVIQKRHGERSRSRSRYTKTLKKKKRSIQCLRPEPCCRLILVRDTSPTAL